MGVIKKQAISNTLVSYIGAFIGYLNFLILLPSGFLPGQIGLIRVIQYAAALFVPLSQLGVVSVIIRYFPFFKAREQQKRSFLFYCVSITLIGFFLFCSIFMIFKNEITALFIEKSPLITDYYLLLIPLNFFLVFFGIFEALTNSNYKTIYSNFLKEIVLRLLTMTLILLYIFELISFYYFIWLFVLAYGIVLILLLIYLLLLGELKIKASYRFLSKSKFKEIFTYGLFVLLGSSGSLFVSSIDTLMISAMLGLKEAGIYSTAFFMAVIIEIPRRAINQIANPFIATAWRDNDLGKINELYEKISLHQLVIGLLLCLGIWINIDYIFELMPNGDIYRAGKYVVLLIMAAKLVDMATGINGEIIGYSTYYKFNIYSLLILALLSVITNLVFIPKLQIVGAAMATVISVFIFNSIKNIFILYKFKLQPFNINTFKVLIIGSIGYLFASLIPDTEFLIVDILTHSLTLSILYGVLIYWANISSDINLIVKKIATRILNR